MAMSEPDFLSRAKQQMAEAEAWHRQQGHTMLDHGLMPELVAEIERLRAVLEATRRELAKERRRDHQAVLAFVEHLERQYREGRVRAAGDAPMDERCRQEWADAMSFLRHQIARGGHLLLQLMRERDDA